MARRHSDARGWVATPRLVARRLVELLAPHLEHRSALFDPACGEGALLLAAAELLGGARALGGIEIDPGRAQRARDQLASAGVRARLDIRTADALDPSIPWPADAALLANPPWISFSGRGAAARPESGKSSSGWPSLHGAFLVRIAEQVARTGLPAAVLTPASVTELERYGPLRAAVSRHAQLLEEPVELGEAAFPGVLGPAVMLLLGPASDLPPTPLAAWTSPDASGGELLRLLGRYPTLPPGSFADPGVHTGNAAADLIADGPGSGRAGIRRGRDLAAFALGPPSQQLCLDLERRPGLRFRRGALERYQGFPILLRQTANRPIAALHQPSGYFRNSLLACRGVAGLDPAFLVAVLNAPQASFWHRAKHRDARQRSFPQVKVSHLAGQPMPFLDRCEAPEAHDEIAARVRALAPGRPGFARDVTAIEARVLEAFALPADGLEGLTSGMRA